MAGYAIDHVPVRRLERLLFIDASIVFLYLKDLLVHEIVQYLRRSNSHSLLTQSSHEGTGAYLAFGWGRRVIFGLVLPPLTDVYASCR